MIPITLSAKYHCLIIQLMPEKGEVDKINYINQVARAIASVDHSDPALFPQGYDPEQAITVSITEELLATTYKAIGSVSERLVNKDNDEIKAALIPQLMAYPEVLATIQAITEQNAQETEMLRTAGLQYVKRVIA